MARPRKPVEAKILDGTFRADRDGAPGEAVVAHGEPALPEGLSGEARAFWDRVVPRLAGLRLATGNDGECLGALCRWWAASDRLLRALEKVKPGAKGTRFLVAQAAQAWDRCERLAGKFGLTPADRAKLRLPAARTGDGEPGVPRLNRDSVPPGAG